MTAVDLNQLEAQFGPSVLIAHETLVKTSGVGDSFSGFADAAAVNVVATIAKVAGTVGSSPSLTLTVEQSSDGVSWSSAGTLVFTDGTTTKSVEIDSPSDRIRVSWAIAGRKSVYSIISVLVVPSVIQPPGGGGGGGGSQPLAAVLAAGGDPDGNPVTGPMEVSPDVGSGGNAFTVKGEDGRNLIIVGDSQGGTYVGLRTDFGDVFEVDLLDGTGAPVHAPFKVRSDVGEQGAIGFYDAQPVARQVVPLTTPSVQDVIDVLLALGLVTQSDG